MGLGKKPSGLGKTLLKSRFHAKTHVNPDGSIRHTIEVDESTINSMKMRSITEENDLDAFLTTAVLAGTDFTAEKLNVTILPNSTASGGMMNPYLLTPEKEAETVLLHEQHKEKLTIPRRPQWDRTTSAEALQLLERDSFLQWRRGLAELEEEHGMLMTPYERNIEVWRQLWRVIERSHLVVQIVDGRNPMLFRSTDLERYVREVDFSKKNLLLVNKADMLTVEQRLMWADYFESQGIVFRFFSAAIAKSRNAVDEENERIANDIMEEYRKQTSLFEDGNMEEALKEVLGPDSVTKDISQLDVSKHLIAHEEHENVSEVPEKARILDVHELVALFEEQCSNVQISEGRKINIGFVGYPNVGKSSTLNAVVGAKKVAVASTPGKTKHFQTIHISEKIVLVDCPGLVFPSFATTKADMVCNGVLPIDQLREITGPCGLVASRIPKFFLDAIYGINIITRNPDGEIANDRPPTSEEFLRTYAVARGYTKASQGNPDEARAARYILKDYITGKLLFVHPPPGVDATKFNALFYEDEERLSQRLKAKTVHDIMMRSSADGQAKKKGQTTMHAVDQEFFDAPIVAARTIGKHAMTDYARTTLYPHQGGQVQAKPDSKKQHKKEKKTKRRDNWTKDIVY